MKMLRNVLVDSTLIKGSGPELPRRISCEPANTFASQLVPLVLVYVVLLGLIVIAGTW